MPHGFRIGAWEVTEPIAAGGWGTVYAGRPAAGAAAQAPTEVPVEVPAEVALKVLPTAGLAPRQARAVAETALREVELGRRAGHPRLIRLLESLVLDAPDRPLLDGALVLVMERAAGTLRPLLEAGVTEARAVRLFTDVCEGLAHLHRSGWVHGDLKPDNVLLMADGSVRLSDFGLATELTGDRGTHGHAPPMGTPDYLPPERWRAPLGEHGVQVRPSADIWALGIMLHEAFAAGASPFPGATPGARAAAVQEYAEGRAPLRTHHAVPPFWRDLVADCLAPTHAARAAHTAESLRARIAAHTPAPAPTPRPPAPRRPRRRRLPRAALAALAACATGAALWAAYDTTRPEGERRVRVFNADPRCRDRTDRDPQCSLGLAVDPHRPYTAGNVVAHRVWHGDVLTAECRLPEGMPIVDEADRQSVEWLRVRLPRGSAASVAWLPAVRTHDRPAVPAC
ncbi:serine/threonine-protein kinase [Streptomyces sp. NPDC048606]|uniref:serine/threonine-protein kinase n=1 Tax=Streptomyces sp. NPDC048606 TaxID=3154726 RepID=UPI003420D23A